jgi:hypothetical protein
MFSTRLSDAELKFAVNAQQLTLPSEDNLRRWGISSPNAHCGLLTAREDGSHGPACGKPYPTALHVLTSCQAALQQGRYTWRHNSVLLVMKQHLVPHIRAINDGRHKFPTDRKLVWKREDGSWYKPDNVTRARAPRSLCDYLARATDWQILFDLPGNDVFTYHVFPPEIAITTARPDVLLVSRKNKWALALELTCPKEERVSDAHQLKADKYAHLSDDALNGWLVSTWPFEVGCRGFVAKSTLKVLRAFHFTRPQQQEIKLQLEDAARRCSYYIWCSRHRTMWDNRPLLVQSGPFKSTKGSDA